MGVKMKKYRVIWEKAINVNGKHREINEEFEANESTQEIKNLVRHKYIGEIKV